MTVNADRFSIDLPGQSPGLIDASSMVVQYGILNSTLVSRACCWLWRPVQQAGETLLQEALRIPDPTARDESYKNLERLYAPDTLSVHSQGMSINYLPALGWVRNFNPGGNTNSPYWAYERTRLTEDCR